MRTIAKTVAAVVGYFWVALLPDASKADVVERDVILRANLHGSSAEVPARWTIWSEDTANGPELRADLLLDFNYLSARARELATTSLTDFSCEAAEEQTFKSVINTLSFKEEQGTGLITAGGHLTVASCAEKGGGSAVRWEMKTFGPVKTKVPVIGRTKNEIQILAESTQDFTFSARYRFTVNDAGVILQREGSSLRGAEIQSEVGRQILRMYDRSIADEIGKSIQRTVSASLSLETAPPTFATLRPAPISAMFYDAGPSIGVAVRFSAKVAELGSDAPVSTLLGERAIRPRAYIHIGAESQRETAQRVAEMLTKDPGSVPGLIVPGIELVSRAPETTQVRVMKSFDTKDALKLKDALAKIIVGQPVLVNLSERYGSSQAIRPKHFEIWFPKGNIELAPMTP